MPIGFTLSPCRPVTLSCTRSDRMASPWANKVAIVTGASSGIGWALAAELARAGCKLGLVARRQDLLDQLAAAVRARGGTVEAAVADVADRDRLLAAVGSLTDRLGPVDLLVANAGVGIPTKWEPPNVPEQVRMIEVNLF